MGIIIPDVEYADAEIWVMTVEQPYHTEETRHLLTKIPFTLDNYGNMKEFREAVFDVVDALEKAYQHYNDGIAIEVKFKNDYVNR